MPKYKNIGNKPEVFQSVCFAPLEEKEVNFYIYHPTMKKTSDDPIYDPVAFSKICNPGDVVELKDVDLSEVSMIKIVSTTRDPGSVCFNAPDSSVVILNRTLEIRPVYKIDTIHVKSGEVSIEFWKTFSWRN